MKSLIIRLPEEVEYVLRQVSYLSKKSMNYHVNQALRKYLPKKLMEVKEENK